MAIEIVDLPSYIAWWFSIVFCMFTRPGNSSHRLLEAIECRSVILQPCCPVGDPIILVHVWTLGGKKNEDRSRFQHWVHIKQRPKITFRPFSRGKGRGPVPKEPAKLSAATRLGFPLPSGEREPEVWQFMGERQPDPVVWCYINRLIGVQYTICKCLKEIEIRGSDYSVWWCLMQLSTKHICWVCLSLFAKHKMFTKPPENEDIVHTVGSL